MDEEYFESQRRKLRFRSTSSMLEVKMEGDWEKANKVFKNLDTEIKAAYIIAQESLARRIRKNILDRIRKQDGDWAALKPNYVKSKLKAGKRPEIWRRTDAIKKNIKIIRRGYSISVGIPKNAKYPGRDDVNLADVASYLEYGTSKGNTLPERPLFRPAYRSLNSATVSLVMSRALKQIMVSKYKLKPSFRLR
jgi:hypothetical protein